MALIDPEAINNATRLADTNLDTILVQTEHLTKLMKDPSYQVGIQQWKSEQNKKEETQISAVCRRQTQIIVMIKKMLTTIAIILECCWSFH
jgi:hypothetical protein